MLSPEIHTIQHSSKFLAYLHPYVFTYDIDSLSVHFWTCIKGSAPAYNGTLQGQILEPSEIRLLSLDRLLIRTHSDKNHIDVNDLLIYQLPGANLLDTLSLGDVGSFDVGAKGLLGVADDKIAVWRHAGPQDGDVIDLYTVSPDGKFGVPRTLKAGDSLSRTHSIRFNGHLSDEPVYIDSDQVLAISTKSKVPSSMYLTRWSTQSDQGTRKVYDFDDTPPSEGEDWWTQLGSHLHIPSSNSLIIASHSSPFGFTNLKPSMTLVSIDTKTTDVNWKTSLQQETEKLVYLPSYDAILAIGDTFTSPTSTSVTILDPHSGAVRQEHVLPAPEANCGRISTSRAGIAIDLAHSQQALIVIFGDGQSTLIPMDKFLKEGFTPFINDKGRFRTVSCPETPFGAPQNAKQRKRHEKGDWSWIHRAKIGDEQAVLVPGDEKGFVVAPFLTSSVV